MWPFKNDKVELVETYNNETGLGMTPCTRTCVKCGHLVAADRAVEVMVSRYAYNTSSSKEYYCEEHAPPYRTVVDYNYGLTVKYYRDRTERTYYCVDGTPFRKEYIS